MEENRINGLTEEEEQEYTKLINLEAMGKGMGKELPEKQKQRLKDLRARIGETLLDTEGEDNSADKEKRTAEYVQEIPYELKGYRNEWKINIREISDESKEKIVKTAENIPVEIENYYDGSRLIKLKLGNKTYKILDAISTIYSDNDYGRKIAKKNITVKQITELELP